MLQDQFGTNAKVLTGATGREASYRRNGTPQLSGDIDLEHDDAYALRALFDTCIPRLRAFRSEPDPADPNNAPPIAVCRHAGIIMPVEDKGDEGIMSFVSPGVFERAEYGFIGPQEFIRNATPAGQVLQDLCVQTEQNGTALGLTFGTLEPTPPIDLAYDSGAIKITADAVEDLGGGFDFEVAPLADSTGQGSTLGRLDVYTRQGIRQAGAIFGYGDGTVGNCKDANRQTLKPINYVIVTGDEGTVGFGYDLASIQKFGQWFATDSLTGVTDVKLLAATAQSMVRSAPETVISIQPDPTIVGGDGNPLVPMPGVHYWLGDNVIASVRKGAFVYDGEPRIDGIEIKIDDEGYEVEHALTIADATATY